MYSIGISCYYHDSSVALFKDRRLIFACEEEKFTGIKHDNSFPKQTLKYIRDTYKLNKENVEVVCFYEDPSLKKERVVEYSKKLIFKKPLYSLRNYLNFLKNKRELKRLLPQLSENIFYSKHHHSHFIN